MVEYSIDQKELLTERNVMCMLRNVLLLLNNMEIDNSILDIRIDNDKLRKLFEEKNKQIFKLRKENNALKNKVNKLEKLLKKFISNVAELRLFNLQ